MKRILLASFTLLFAMLACGQPPAGFDGEPAAATGWTAFSVERFSVDLPAGWSETESADEQVILAVSDGAASLWVKAWPLIPSLVAKGVGDWIAGNQNVDLLAESGSPEKTRLEMALLEKGTMLRMSSLLFYCDAKTYEVTAVAAQNDFDQYAAIFAQARESAQCDRTGLAPLRQSGALGMIVIPPAVDGDNFSPAAYQEALALARRSGVQISHYYFHWGDIEKEPGAYDWGVPDYIVEANALEGLQLSIVVSIIHTTVRGRIPADLAGRSFDNPVFVRRLSDFLSAFAERYAGRLHYLAIGNEVNDYFVNHREQIPAYAAAFAGRGAAIHAVNPDLPVGIVFAYHDAETQNTTDIIQALNRGDYIAYTMYLYNQGFHFRRDPAEIGAYLDRMIALAAGTPVAIVETGWSTAAELEGSEEGQAEYVRQLFAALSQRREKIRFVSWFAMHDPRPESCASDAMTFFEPGTEPDQEFMQAFVTFICYFGLRESNGTPKLGWEVWVQEAPTLFSHRQQSVPAFAWNTLFDDQNIFFPTSVETALVNGQVFSTSSDDVGCYALDADLVHLDEQRQSFRDLISALTGQVSKTDTDVDLGELIVDVNTLEAANFTPGAEVELKGVYLDSEGGNFTTSTTLPLNEEGHMLESGRLFLAQQGGFVARIEMLYAKIAEEEDSIFAQPGTRMERAMVYEVLPATVLDDAIIPPEGCEASTDNGGIEDGDQTGSGGNLTIADIPRIGEPTNVVESGESLIYNTDYPVDAVVDFYKSELGALGWEVDDEFTMDGLATLEFINGDQTIYISIIDSGDSVLVSVDIY